MHLAFRNTSGNSNSTFDMAPILYKARMPEYCKTYLDFSFTDAAGQTDLSFPTNRQSHTDMTTKDSAWVHASVHGNSYLATIGNKSECFNSWINMETVGNQLRSLKMPLEERKNLSPKTVSDQGAFQKGIASQSVVSVHTTTGLLFGKATNSQANRLRFEEWLLWIP